MLDKIIPDLPPDVDVNLLVGNHSADDAAVYRLRDDLALIHTVDFFTPVVDDPFLFGVIAVANSLSDVYAMGGKPILALNVIGFHQGKVKPPVVRSILEGGKTKATEAGCIIAGGHSIQDQEMKYGLAVTGVVHPEHVWRNDTVQEGDVIVLTKPLGTGAISTALKHEQAQKEDLEEIIASMALLNSRPVEILQSGEYDVHACTDVTGFGLSGHLLEMLSSNAFDVQLRLKALPVFRNIERYLTNPAFLPGGFYNNRFYAAPRIASKKPLEEPEYNILFDPQTSGGLLISLNEKEAQRFLAALENSDYPYQAVIIGKVQKGRGRILLLEE